MPTYLDFSSAGWKAGVIEFFKSLGKTALAAALAFVLLKLKDLHLANYVRPEYATLAIATVAAVRALITSVWVWATTTDVTAVTSSATLGDGSVLPA